ncbi:beta-lactamase/transpeptidase-like protein [Hysterangium stoloniferum]|nr:beta-lactamase/transpeptidase-like protein [Hysterangium stoloniferum]
MEQQEISHACRPFLPRLTDAPEPTRAIFESASRSLDRFLRTRTAKEDIDSLSIAIITPSGPIFQKGYGILKANETDPLRYGTVDQNSIYRIASISKMFTVAGTLIQRDRGALNWDDSITKFFPNFTYNPNSWADNTDVGLGDHGSIEPITIRQLASHMAGIPRDCNLGEIEWPPKERGGEPTKIVPPTKEQLFELIARTPLVVPPYSYPVYSNAGMGLLGLANVAANNAHEQPSNISTWADLAQRDIFRPIGMNSSSFKVTSDMAHRVAVASRYYSDTDLDLGEVYNPAGGQYSSLVDLSAFMQTILDPHRANAVLSPYTVREWLRPLHGWEDDLNEVGAPWEIVKYTDSTGRPVRFYEKGGNLDSHHSVFSVNPVSSYGVIVLIAGRYSQAEEIAREAITRFQPIFDRVQEASAQKSFGGHWSSGTGKDNQAVIKVRRGSLWLERLILQGVDFLALIQSRNPGKGKPVALWSTYRTGEFRYVIAYAYGRPQNTHTGCLLSWVTFDGIYANGAPIDMLYFKEDSETGENVLHIPSLSTMLKRVSAK